MSPLLVEKAALIRSWVKRALARLLLVCNVEWSADNDS